MAHYTNLGNNKFQVERKHLREMCLAMLNCNDSHDQKLKYLIEIGNYAIKINEWIPWDREIPYAILRMVKFAIPDDIALVNRHLELWSNL